MYIYQAQLAEYTSIRSQIPVSGVFQIEPRLSGLLLELYTEPGAVGGTVTNMRANLNGESVSTYSGGQKSIPPLGADKNMPVLAQPTCYRQYK